MDEMTGRLTGGDAETRELIEVATDEDELPEVRRSARESLQRSLVKCDLVELMDGWELHADFGGLTVVRDLAALGHLVKAYLEVVGPSDELYTNIATAIGGDFRSHLQEMAETVVDESIGEASDPRLGA